MSAAAEYGAEIIPVDSEHSAVFQCLQGCRDRGEVRRILLTCSGGPFYGKTYDQLEHVTAADALRHPQLAHGREDHHRQRHPDEQGIGGHRGHAPVRLPVEQVQPVIHRRVSSTPLWSSARWCWPAGHAGYEAAHPLRPDLSLPRRNAGRAAGPAPMRRADLRRPGRGCLPCLRLARQCGKTGGTSCAILNGANEAAVALFLRGDIGFNDIHRCVERPFPGGGEISAKPGGYTGSRQGGPSGHSVTFHKEHRP